MNWFLSFMNFRVTKIICGKVVQTNQKRKMLILFAFWCTTSKVLIGELVDPDYGVGLLKKSYPYEINPKFYKDLIVKNAKWVIQVPLPTTGIIASNFGVSHLSISWSKITIIGLSSEQFWNRFPSSWLLNRRTPWSINTQLFRKCSCISYKKESWKG